MEQKKPASRFLYANRKPLLVLLALTAACLLSLYFILKPSAPPEEEGILPVHFAAGDVAPDASELRLPLASGETALLSALPNLNYADLSGSEDPAEVAAWAKEHPEVSVLFTVTLPDGTVLDSSTRSFDMSGMSPEACLETAPALALLPELKSVNLGREGGPIGWDTVDRLHAILPETPFKYAFTLYGQPCDLSNMTINLRYVPVNDGGAAVKKVMAYMPELQYLDMDSCGVSNEDMEAIRLAYPDVKVVWRIWFGDAYSVRTDVQRILASRPTTGGAIMDNTAKNLFYCHDVVFLDLGHSGGITNIEFVRGMPKLEVAILITGSWTDASPLTACPELEYLEIFSTFCNDLTPLAELHNLKHLNIANNPNFTDLSPLYGLTQLERLWLGCVTRVSDEQVEEFHRRVPDCEINTTVYDDPTAGHWRYDDDGNQVPRYYLLRMQFDGYKDEAFAFWWNDPLYPKPDQMPAGYGG